MTYYHISPNMTVNDCVGPDGPEGCAYKKQGIELEHFTSLREAQEYLELFWAEQYDPDVPRAEITEQQAQLIPAVEAAGYAADAQKRARYNELRDRYDIINLFHPEDPADVPPAPRATEPFELWSVETTERHTPARVTTAGTASQHPGNTQRAQKLLNEHRQLTQGLNTTANVIAADTKYPSYKNLLNNHTKYLNRIENIGERRYSTYQDTQYQHYLTQYTRMLAKQTPTILTRLASGAPYSNITDTQREELFYTTAYILQNHPDFRDWAEYHKIPEKNGVPVPSSMSQFQDLLRRCGTEPDANGDYLLMSNTLDRVDSDDLDFSELVTISSAPTPELTPAEALAGTTSEGDPDFEHDLKALQWNDILTHGMGSYTQQAQLKRYPEDEWGHYEHPAYRSIRTVAALKKAQPGNILVRKLQDGSNQYAVALQSTPDGVLYQTVPSYSGDNSPVVSDAQRAYALFAAGARTNETPVGFTPFSNDDQTLRLEGWMPW